LPINRRAQLGLFAPQLIEKCADFAHMRFGAAFTRCDDQPAAGRLIGVIGRSVIVIAVGIVVIMVMIVMPVSIAVYGAANDRQAVVMAIVRHKRVQTLPE
jgi:uncharacterized membrane protein YjgN (DUF898 family)